MAEDWMHIEERGAGEPVVLLHGVPTHPMDFDPLVAVLSSTRRVLVPHLPGYGRSPSRPGPYSLLEVIELLEAALLARGVARAAFVAVSGGAYKALAIALARRIEVTHLALLAPMIGLDDDGADMYRKLASAVRSGVFDPRASWLQRMAAPGFAERDPEGAARVLAWLDAAPLPLILDELVAQADAEDLRPRSSEVDLPLLVCSGSADNALLPGYASRFAQHARGVQFEAFAGAGHALMLEEPGRVTSVVCRFLEHEGFG